MLIFPLIIYKRGAKTREIGIITGIEHKRI